MFLEYPPDWDLNVHGNCTKIILEYNTEEYRKIRQCFCDTLPHVEVRRIERIQNKIIWREFQRKRRKLCTQGFPNEVLAFHGTTNTKPSEIYSSEEGFDMRFSRDGLFGRGNYFALNAVYSYRRYAYCHNEMTRVYQLLVARVLPGACIHMDRPQKLIAPPPRPRSNEDTVQRKYNSVSSTLGGSLIYVTYEPYLAYPEYLISYVLP